MAADRLHVFGIRHHGPGSASSLLAALDASDPGIVLIEGPPEGDALIPFAAAPDMRPPVALLVHATEAPSLASFFPFAEYSPEWQAMLWALRRGRPVRFIDLPACHRLASLNAVAKEKAAAAEEDDEPAIKPRAESKVEEAPRPLIRHDPLAYLAKLAGYDDGEAWWNTLIEQTSNAPQIFVAIEEAMTALRERADAEQGEDTAGRLFEEQREAHMRLAIGDARKETEGPVAVVTGAWHVPALRRRVARAEDRAILRDLPKIKVTVTWVPWTDTRLASLSGYRAGVVSPGWYRHLWHELRHNERDRELNPNLFAARWQTNVARLLREAGRLTDAASVIEAVRLSQTLAALRSIGLPGLQEMQEATLATLCQGEAAPLRLIETQLIIGTEVGKVGDGVPQMPLQADLSRLQKQTKLKPESLDREVALDLRSDAGLAKSLLLHRLCLLQVPWGKLLDSGGSRGTFRERWMLRWEPEFSVRLAEALVHGTTVEQASGNASIAAAKASKSLAELSGIVQGCLLAGLEGASRTAIALLQSAAAATSDIAALLPAIPPLATILRYGTAREIPAAELRLLAGSLVEIVCAGLVYACRGLDAEQSGTMRQQLGAFDRAVSMLDDEGLTSGWRAALSRLHQDTQVSALVAGFAVRTLYDAGVLDAEKTATHLSHALSPSVPPARAGEWLDGFLASSGEVLLHDPRLLDLIDQWLTGLPEGDFVAQLPALRRTFSSFDRTQRRRLLDKASEQARPGAGTAYKTEANSDADAPGFAGALPLLLTILGVKIRENSP